ncbi:hypothetical protein Tco_0219596 [Tanacetum coccineum]
MLEVVLLSDTTQIGSYQVALSLRALVERASDLGFHKFFYCSSEYISRTVHLKKKIVFFELRFMASSVSDRDAKDALSKLLQMDMVTEYQNEFKVLISRVTEISESLLKTIYISVLKVALQIELLRARPTTLVEAFSLACMTDTRFEDERTTTTIAKPNYLNLGILIRPWLG